ncbi:unnamed protein product, partial [Allacma fusca]
QHIFAYFVAPGSARESEEEQSCQPLIHGFPSSSTGREQPQPRKWYPQQNGPLCKLQISQCPLHP